MLRVVSLEYNLGHPHPKGHWFLLATVLIFIFAVPALVLVNLATLGYDLVPSLKNNFTSNEDSRDVWWGNRRLPYLLRPRYQSCDPKELTRGDTFRLSGGIFDYTVMSVWNTSKSTEEAGTQGPSLVEYTGQSFAHCFANSSRFDYSLVEQTQTLTVGVFCSSSDSFKADVSMQTTVTFAWTLGKDFIGQYYGPGLEPEDLVNADPLKYRRTVLAALQVISTDSLTIMRHSDKHLPNPLLSASMTFFGNQDTTLFDYVEGTFAYMNGSTPTPYHESLAIYFPGIYNILNLVIDAVHLDLGNLLYPNAFRNASRLNELVGPNLAPAPPDVPVAISAADWAEGSKPFYFNQLTTYQTWAQALLDGVPVQLNDGSLTLPSKSVMATGYLCPTYRVKPLGPLLVSVFVGSATMILSVWSAWMFFTAFLARRMMPPRVICHCSDCEKRREIDAEEARKRAENPIQYGALAGFVAFMKGTRRPIPTSAPRDEERTGVEALGYREPSRPARPDYTSEPFDGNKHVSYLSTSTAGAK
ncbi:hypothetical protein RSOLAG1IB_08816 [Rhizoctonia solani AG-1 IB]|uniref:Transmembrane protein n=1 Tax=Thanatephorus cucumeris (strain AG1-IB / isolate 7/3/14) TaxID=1108050 RepID=A0A0B7FM62_THACB|nr:hypothetical protein RSOLAG1IB_08816 [Rhizoctonia solani AG-1 IB]